MQPDAQKVAATNVFAREQRKGDARLRVPRTAILLLRGEPLGVAVVERRVEMVPQQPARVKLGGILSRERRGADAR